MASQCHIFELPEELLLDIAEYLLDSSLKAFSQTSQCFRRIGLQCRERERKVKGHRVLLWDYTNEKEPYRHWNGRLPEINIDNKELDGYNTLLTACEGGDLGEVQALLDKGVSPNPPECAVANKRDGNAWYTPIEAAARSDHADVIDLLVASGADLSILNNDDKIRIVCTHYRGNSKAIEALVRGGLDIHADGDYGNTLLHSMWYYFRQLSPNISAPLVQRLLDYGLNGTRFNGDGHSPVRVAIRELVFEPSPEVVAAFKLLLRSMRSVDLPCDAHGDSPLFTAINHGRGWILKLLIYEFDASLTAQLVGGSAVCPLEICLGTNIMWSLAPALRIVFDAWIDKLQFQRPNLLLVAAALLGDLTMVKKILPHCTADDDSATYSEERALREAAGQGHGEVVEFFLSRSASANCPDYSYKTLEAAFNTPERLLREVLSRTSQAEIDRHVYSILAKAATHCAPDSVRQILDRVAVPILTDDMASILQAATRNRLPGVLKVLLEYSRRQELTAPDNKVLASLLAEALNRWSGRAMKGLVDDGHVDLEAPHENGNTALALAVQDNRPENLKLLIDAGASLTVPVIRDQWAISVFGRQREEPLIVYAAFHGSAKLLDVLLASEADPRVLLPHDSGAVLIKVCEKGNYSYAKSLVHEQHADIHKADDRGMTALSYAARSGFLAIVGMLLEAGARADNIHKDGTSPLFLACASELSSRQSDIQTNILYDADFNTVYLRPGELEDRLKTARLLLDAGSSLSPRDEHGRTAFSHVAASDREDFVRLFLESGVDINEVDMNGRTALSWACAHALPGTVRILVEAGADVCKADKNGKTPLEYIPGGFDETVGALYARTCNDLHLLRLSD